MVVAGPQISAIVAGKGILGTGILEIATETTTHMLVAHQIREMTLCAHGIGTEMLAQQILKEM